MSAPIVYEQRVSGDPAENRRAAGVCRLNAGKDGYTDHKKVRSVTLNTELISSLDEFDALRADLGLAKGLNTWQGGVTYAPVAEALDLPLQPFS